MQTLSVRTDSIEIGERHRALSTDAAERLAASMKAIGLKQPISIRIVDLMVIDGQEVEGVPVLVAGRHRLEAARILGWSHIDCFEVDDDQIQAEMWELAENLHRNDLTKEQRDEHIRRFAELLNARQSANLQSAQNAAIESKRQDGRGHRPEGVAAKIARATGLSKDTIRRALKPQPKPVQSAAPLPVHDAVEKQVAALMNAWNRAGREARELFLGKINERIAA